MGVRASGNNGLKCLTPVLTKIMIHYTQVVWIETLTFLTKIYNLEAIWLFSDQQDINESSFLA